LKTTSATTADPKKLRSSENKDNTTGQKKTIDGAFWQIKEVRKRKGRQLASKKLL